MINHYIRKLILSEDRFIKMTVMRLKLNTLGQSLIFTKIKNQKGNFWTLRTELDTSV